jgi:hypothetical protein
MAYYRTTFSGQIFRFVCGSEQLLHCSHAPRHRAPPDATEWRYGTLRQALKRNTDCHWTGRYFDKKPVKNFLQELELNSYDQVSYIVSGIISYSRWPEGTRPSKACIVGSTRYIKALLAQNDSNNTYAWQYFQENNYSDLEGCEIIYIGSLNASEMDSLLLRT